MYLRAEVSTCGFEMQVEGNATDGFTVIVLDISRSSGVSVFSNPLLVVQRGWFRG